MMHGATDHAGEVTAELTPEAVLGNIASALLIAPWQVQAVAAGDLPEPARVLLDHACGMTQSLETRWGEAMTLHVHTQRDMNDRLYRLVALRGAQSGRIREIAAIRIWLGRLPRRIEDDVRAGQHPLGRLLADAGIAFASRPEAFLQAHCPDVFARELNLDPKRVLPGRISRLHVGDSPLPLCETVELLPET